MKQILEQKIEINHLKYAQSFSGIAREHPQFTLPLQLRTEPTFIPLSSGELLLVSEYVSNSTNSLLLNLYYVHKYVNNSWKEILAIPHAEKVRVQGKTIYAIVRLEENQYSVRQYNLDGCLIQQCIIENEPNTQINLDSIYFLGNQVVYCYQYFLKQLPYVDRNKYTSTAMLEWREDTKNELLSVYGYSAEQRDAPYLFNYSLNMCALRVRWQELDGAIVWDKDLEIKSFHQIVSLLHGDVMQICYTEPDPLFIRPQDEYEYYVCFVYPDGTIQDCSHMIPKGNYTRFHMQRQFSETTPNSIFYTCYEEIPRIYEVIKGKTPKDVYCTNGISLLGHQLFLLKGKNDESSACIKNAHHLAQEYIKFRGERPISALSENEREEFTEYLRDCGSGKYRESLDELFNIDMREKKISNLKILEDESALRVFGVAYRKIFASACYIDDEDKSTDTASALYYYDIDVGKGILIDADSPHKRYVLNNVSEHYFSYFSGNSAPRMGYKQVKVICKDFTGSLIGELFVDSKDPCLGAIEHQGIIHVLTKNKVAFKTRQEMPPTILTFTAYLIKDTGLEK